MNLPTKKQNRLIQARIDVELVNHVIREAKKRKIKVKEALEFGLKAFLLACLEEETKERETKP